MNILFYYFSGSGGGFSNIAVLLKQVIENGTQHQFYIACLSNNPLAEMELPNLNVLPIDVGIHKELTRYRFGRWELSRLIREYEIDLLWSVNTGAYRRPEIPQVLTLNNSYVIYPWQEICEFHPRGKLHLKLLRRFGELSMRNSVAVVVQTPLMQEIVQDRLAADSIVVVIPKSVDNEENYAMVDVPQDVQAKIQLTEKEGTEAFTFLYCTSLDPHKNIAVLVKALTALNGRAESVRLLITCDERELIKRFPMAKELIAKKRLLCLGWVDKSWLKSLYETCDAIVAPSLLESLSSSLLEAMKWGLPIIAADKAFTRKTCCQAAVYVDGKDSNAWADEMLRLSEDQNLRETLVEKGKARIAEYPARWSEVANDYLQLFAKLHNSPQ